MTDLERLLNKLVNGAREDATDGFTGLSLTTRTTTSTIREVFTELVRQRINPLLKEVIDAAQADARNGADISPATREALGKVRYAYDDLFPETDEY